MNIFVLSTQPEVCARYHCDKHLIKMISETCQILSTVVKTNPDFDGPEYLYKPTHKNHPCVKWVNETYHNMYWLSLLLEELIKEYDHRFGNADKFIIARKISEYFIHGFPYGAVFKYNIFQITEWVKCMPEKYKVPSIQKSYWAYYINEKSHMFKWTNREVPFWIKNKY